MTKCNKTFINGFVKGVLAPVTVLSSMYGIPRTPVEDPFKDLKLGSVQTDKQKIQSDFDRAIKEFSNERHRAEVRH